MAIGVFLFNTGLGIIPVGQVSASISTQELLDLHNQERGKAGLQTLKINVALTNSAQAKAQAMLESDCWSHYCPAGKSPWDFFNNAGYNYMYAGENLAEGFFNNQDVMVAWMNSPTHRENVLKPEYSEVGFGVVIGKFQGKENNVLIVVHFGTPQPVRTTNSPNTNNNSGVPQPEITQPEDGAAFNSPNLTIKGTAEGATQVELRRNGARWITADPNQGIFTYEASGLTEQSYQIVAISHNGANESSPSKAVNFQIDLTPDPINVKQILVASLTDKDELKIQITVPSLSKAYMVISNSRVDFQKETDTLWTATISRSLFLNATQFTLGDVDEAGNQWSTQIDSAIILIQTQNLPVDSADPSVGRVISSNTKASVNAAFLVILTILFGLDFLILSRSGVTRKDFKSHFHFAVFAIIGIIAVSGIVSGSVGIGLSSLT